MRATARGPRVTASDLANRRLRAENAALKAALQESEALKAELHAQLDRANAACVRLAKRLASFGTIRRAA